jgi:hypothetical protein
MWGSATFAFGLEASSSVPVAKLDGAHDPKPSSRAYALDDSISSAKSPCRSPHHDEWPFLGRRYHWNRRTFGPFRRQLSQKFTPIASISETGLAAGNGPSPKPPPPAEASAS